MGVQKKHDEPVPREDQEWHLEKQQRRREEEEQEKVVEKENLKEEETVMGRTLRKERWQHLPALQNCEDKKKSECVVISLWCSCFCQNFGVIVPISSDSRNLSLDFKNFGYYCLGPSLFRFLRECTCIRVGSTLHVSEKDKSGELADTTARGQREH